MADYEITDNVLAVYHCKGCFIKLSIIATSHFFTRNVLTNIANSICPDQTDHIVSVGSVSTLIESVLSTEWHFQLNGSA